MHPHHRPVRFEITAEQSVVERNGLVETIAACCLQAHSNVNSNQRIYPTLGSHLSLPVRSQRFKVLLNFLFLTTVARERSFVRSSVRSSAPCHWIPFAETFAGASITFRQSAECSALRLGRALAIFRRGVQRKQGCGRKKKPVPSISYLGLQRDKARERGEEKQKEKVQGWIAGWPPEPVFLGPGGYQFLGAGHVPGVFRVLPSTRTTGPLR